ncbi:MAG TPA: hypothetical protein PLO23_11305, partial [Alphaproteobacteria bacterium]|nr:hypothetical protein [Alphaproteobacteria bacterium]
LPVKDRAEGALTRGFLRFVGEKPDFVRKDEVGEHIAEALFLGLPVGLTTYGISSYLGAWGFLAAAGTSASLIMAAKAMAIVLPTAAAIYMLDSSILKSIKNYGLDKYIELRKIIDDGKKDADMVAKNLAAADTLKDKAKRTMEGGSFLMFNGSLLARFVLSSAFAIVTTAKIVDVSLHSQDVDAIIVERDHQIQKELEEGPGLSRDEIIAEKKGELDEAKSELALHKGEVEKLESQLTGAVSVHLSEAEKARIAALEGDISKLSTELQEQQKLRQQHIDVRSQEEHTGSETSNKKAGRGSEWRLADGRVKAADEEIARLENQIRIKTADIDRINDGAREAAVAAAANESEVRAGRKDD